MRAVPKNTDRSATSRSSSRRGQVRRTYWGDVRRRFFRNRLSLLGLALVVLVSAVALGAPITAPQGYNEQQHGHIMELPSRQFPLGTDLVGRDMVARIIWGTRISLIVGFSVSFVSLLIGVPLGAIAAWRGGRVDWAVLRLIDLISALPWYVMVMFLITILGSGMSNVILTMAITNWVEHARVVRAQLLVLREQEYVLAARAIGARDRRILLRHLVPGAMTPIIIGVAAGIPAAIFGEASLSFLGLGIGPPYPSLGQMIQQGLAEFLVFYHMALFPGIAIAIIVLGFNLMADGLRDALDPQMMS